MDEELQLLPGGLTPSLQEVLVRLGAWMPFEKAGAMLVDFMGLSSVSEATVRRHTEEAGAAYVAFQEQGVEQLEQTLPAPPPGPAQLVLEVDGAMVPLVGGEWAEVKTLVIGEVGQPVLMEGEWQVPLQEISSFSRLTDCESFTRLALVETHRRGVSTAGRVAALGDGAEWIPGFVDYHRPDAVRILDFPHAGEYVDVMGGAVFGAGTAEAKAWLSDQLHCLKHQGGGAALAELRSFAHTHAAAADLSKPLAYLEKREAQMAYPAFQAAGWPIGSGAVESANKLVVEARLKGAGMHWAPGNVDPMLALRNIVCSDRWAEGWPQIAAYVRQQATQRRQERRQKRHRAAPLELATMAMPEARTLPQREVTELLPGEPQAVATTTTAESRIPYRPAANHPWRRSPIGHARYRPAHSELVKG